MSPGLAVFLVILALAALFGVLKLLTVRKAAATEASHKIRPVGDKPFPGGNPPASEVYIGPTLWDGPHSDGMPLHPTSHPSGVGWTVAFPIEGKGKVDYVEFNHGSLAGKSRIVIDYDLSLGEGVAVHATAQPEMGDTGTNYRARITPHFQQEGDDWSAGGQFEPYRWYFDTGADLHYLEAGAHTIEAPLAGPGWGATQTSTFENNPAGFKAAIAHTCAVGFVIGGNGIGIGHGGDATGEAVLWVKRLEVL